MTWLEYHEQKNWNLAKRAIIERCHWDLTAFALYFFAGKAVKSSFAINHIEYFKVESERILSGKRNTNRLFMWPRGGAKSTIITKIGSIHDICYNLENYILLASDTDNQSKQKCRSIRNEIKNNFKLKRVYGLAPGDPWNQKQFKTNNGVLFQATSVDSENRGFIEDDNRPSRFIGDDIESTKSSTSPTIRQSTKDFYNEVVSYIGSTESNIDICGTKTHQEGLLSDLERRPDFQVYKYRGLMEYPTNEELWNEWKEIYTNLDNANHEEDAKQFYLSNIEAMNEGGKVLWPQNFKPKYPDKLYELMATRIEVGEGSFNKEIQNEPLDPERQIFDMDRADYFELVNIGGHIAIERKPGGIVYQTGVDELTIYCVVDPAGAPKAKKSRTDFTCILILGRDDNGRFYVLDTWLKRAKANEWLTAMFEMCSPERWNVHSLRIKETGTMGLAYEAFRREKTDRETRGQWCDISASLVTESGDKVERIGKLEPFVSNNWISFNQKLQHEAMNQMKQFPNGDHDDFPDCLEEGVRAMRGSRLG